MSGTGQQGVDAHDSSGIASNAGNLKSAGYSFVCQYIDQYSDADLGASGSLTYGDATTDIGAGLGIVSIFETTDMSSTDGGSYTWETYLTQTQPTGPDGTGPAMSQGTYDAMEAYNSALALGQPSGTTIYFAMDFDPAATSAGFTQADAESVITSFFQDVDTYFAQQANDGGRSYSVGVYGAGQTLEWLTTTDQSGTSTPLVSDTWRTGSTGWEDSSGTTATDGTPWTLIQTIPGVSTTNPATVDGVPVDYDTNQASNYGAWTSQDPAPCFAGGTCILTERGEVPVEQLRVGDRVVALRSGGLVPVQWIGHRRIDLRRHQQPWRVHPVRVARDAFGEGRPHRDLWLSPGHSVFVDGVLMQIERLINGATIAQVPQDEVTYWHVELAEHDILLAEGLAAESYLDTGNRAHFANGGASLALHPDFAPQHAAETCVPLVEGGPQVAAVKARLLERAQERFGCRVTAEHGLHVLADGQTVLPEARGETYRFALPAGARDVRLVSRTWVPRELCPESEDERRLGVCVRGLALDGRAAALRDPALREGWHAPERDAEEFRWTGGSARLPGGVREVRVELCGARLYWADDAVPVCGTSAAGAA